MKKFLGININKNLAKKGTIIALALVVVIGMSYFGSKDYLNMSIMDMLMGDTGGADCTTDVCKNGGTVTLHGVTATLSKDSQCQYNKDGTDCDCANAVPAEVSLPSDL